MPCRSYEDDHPYPYSRENVDKLKKQVDSLARIACKAMDELVKQGKADFLLMKDKEVREWYEKHVEADRKAREAAEAKRKAAEARPKEKARVEKLKAAALSKLTVEEREALLGKKSK